MKLLLTLILIGTFFLLGAKSLFVKDAIDGYYWLQGTAYKDGKIIGNDTITIIDKEKIVDSKEFVTNNLGYYKIKIRYSQPCPTTPKNQFEKLSDQWNDSLRFKYKTQELHIKSNWRFCRENKIDEDKKGCNLDLNFNQVRIQETKIKKD